MTHRLKLDISLLGADSLAEIPEIAMRAESDGLNGLWASEVNHDPFLQLALAAHSTQRIELGTAIALSFVRSPMALAYSCWDLAALSKGRFILGLGTQVKAHNERRFAVKWEAPVPRLREIIGSLRAIWDSWRTGERLNFRGSYYQFTLMTPFFTPPGHQFKIPITIAGVNTGLCRLAGELCDGFHIHPLHSVRYLNNIVFPAIKDGAIHSGRAIDEISLYASLFVVTGQDRMQTDFTRELVRQQISFYASTPSYRVIFETHGWGAIADELSHLAARKRWGDMPALITDEMIETFAVVAEPDMVGKAAVERYRGLVDRVTYYLPFQPDRMDKLWQTSIKAFAEQI